MGMLWIVILVFSAIWLALVHSWAKDLLFYKRNGWDFTQDSGEKLYHGEVETPETLTSNRHRVLHGMPAVIVGFAVIIVVLIVIPDTMWNVP